MGLIKILSQVPITDTQLPTSVPLWATVTVMVITAIIGFWKEIKGTYEKYLSNKNNLELKRIEAKAQEDLTCQERIDKLEKKLYAYEVKVKDYKDKIVDYKIVVASLNALLPLMKVMIVKYHPDYDFMLDNFEASVRKIEEHE